MTPSDRRFNPRNAGGTEGGVGSFLSGLALMIVGGYLFLRSVYVTYGLSTWGSLYSVYGWHVQGGTLLIPAVIGVALIFYKGSSFLGWFLALGSVLALCAGIVANLSFSLVGMSLFDLLLVLALIASGFGLFARSLRRS